MLQNTPLCPVDVKSYACLYAAKCSSIWRDWKGYVGSCEVKYEINSDGPTAPPFSTSPPLTIPSKEKAEPLLFYLYRENNTGFVAAVRCFSPLRQFPSGSSFGAGDRRGVNDPKTATNQKIPGPSTVPSVPCIHRSVFWHIFYHDYNLDIILGSQLWSAKMSNTMR